MRSHNRNCRLLRAEILEGRLLLAGDDLLPASLALGVTPQHAEFAESLQPAEVFDELQLVVNEAGRLRVWTDPAPKSRLDSFLSLYGRDGPDGRLLIQSDDAPPDVIGEDDAPQEASGALIEQHLSPRNRSPDNPLPGSYRLTISASPSAEEASTVGAYRLTIDWQPATAPFEPNPVETQPLAIARGDFNGDGILDLATANAWSNDVSILLGLGEGTFWKQQTIATGGESSSSIVTADLDGDGDLDLAVGNAASNSVSVLLGRGDGTFGPGVLIASVGEDPRSLAAGDLDRDGILDLVVSNYRTGTISLLIGRGDGTFDDADKGAGSTYREYATARELIDPVTLEATQDPRGGNARSVAIADFNGDTYPDIAVANRDYDEVQLFLGNAQGTYELGATVGVGNSPSQVVVADLDKDHNLDIATANDRGDSVSVRWGNGDGTFRDGGAEYAVGDDSEFVLSAQFNDDNGDGVIDDDDYPDLATGNEDSRDLSILLNRGDGTFQQPTAVPVYQIPDELAAGDFNGDGRVDLAMVSREVGVIILPGLGDGTFQWEERFGVGDDPEAMVRGDFNRDGLADLAVANGRSDDVSILLGRGDGTFQPALRYALARDFDNDDKLEQHEKGRMPHAIVAADFNRDGRLDLATANEHSENVSILLGLGDGDFLLAEPVPVGDSPWSLVAEDFDGDGLMDLATADRKSSQVTVLYGEDGGGFESRKYPVGDFPERIITADFDRDGRPDLGTVNRLSHDVSMLHKRDDNGRFDPAQSTQSAANFAAHVLSDPSNDPANVFGWSRESRAEAKRTSLRFLPRLLVTGDYNRDGHLDLAVADDRADEISIFLGYGDGTYQPAIRLPTLADPEFIATADFDGDGNLDLVTANDHKDAVSVLLGLGTGGFRDEQVYKDVADQPEGVVVGDFNGDGNLDLAIANEGRNSLSVLMGDGDGTFSKDETVYPDRTAFAGMVAGDFTGDDILDLATMNRSSGTILIYPGDGKGKFPSILPGDRAGEFPATLPPIPPILLDVRLFSLALAPPDESDGQVIEELDREVIPEDLRREFANHQIGLSEDASVSTEEAGSRWLLVDGSVQYRVSRDASRLSVFRVGQAVVKYLATADLDEDGHLDLVAADLGQNRVWVLWGLGDGEFEVDSIELGRKSVSSPRDYSIRPVEIGDFNGDGHADVATVDELAGTVSLLLGNGKRSFLKNVEENLEKNYLRFPVGKGPGTLTAGDFDHNGNLDLVAGNRHSFDLSILPGNGDGSFQPETRIAAGQEPLSEVRFDFNRDGRVDRAIADDNTNDVSVSLDMGQRDLDSTRIAAEIRSTPILADLDGDGTADSIQLDLRGEILVRFGQPGQPGTFLPPQVVNPASRARDVAVVSTSAGILLAAVNQQVDQQKGAITLYGIDENRHFKARDGEDDHVFPTENGAFPTKIASADLNADGQDDLVLIDGAAQSVSVFLAGEGKFSLHASLAVGNVPSSLALMDVGSPGDGPDGSIDIVVANEASGDVDIFLNDGTGSFDSGLRLRASAGPYGVSRAEGGWWAVRSRVQTTGIAGGDFNQDGRIDLVLTNRGRNTFAVLFGKSSGGFADPVWFPAGSGPAEVRAADLDGDGHLDLAVLNQGDSTVSVYYGDGNGGFGDVVTADAGSSPSGLSIADLDGDHLLDLLVANGMADLLIQSRQDGGDFVPLTRNGSAVAMAVGDFNRDGQEDTVVVKEGSSRLTVWLADGEDFVEHATRGLDDGLAGPRAVDVIELNGDGYQDIIVTNTGANNVLVFLGKGDGRFDEARQFAAGMSPVGLTAADLNADGLLDLAVANELSSDVSIWLGDPAELLRPGPRLPLWSATEEGVFGLRPVSIETTENDDGLIDLIVSNRDSNNTFLFPGRGGGFFGAPIPFKADPILFDSAGQILVGQFNASEGNDLVLVDHDSRALWMYDRFLPDAIRSLPLPTLGSIAVLTDDFNLDGRSDLAFVNRGGRSVSVLYAGAATFGRPEPLLENLEWSLAAWELVEPAPQTFLGYSEERGFPFPLYVTPPAEDDPFQIGGFDENVFAFGNGYEPVSRRGEGDTDKPSGDEEMRELLGEFFDFDSGGGADLNWPGGGGEGAPPAEPSWLVRIWEAIEEILEQMQKELKEAQERLNAHPPIPRGDDGVVQGGQPTSPGPGLTGPEPLPEMGSNPGREKKADGAVVKRDENKEPSDEVAPDPKRFNAPPPIPRGPLSRAPEMAGQTPRDSRGEQQADDAFVERDNASGAVRTKLIDSIWNWWAAVFDSDKKGKVLAWSAVGAAAGAGAIGIYSIRRRRREDDDQAPAEGKGVRNLLCAAPFGPFRQKVPDPFSLRPTGVSDSTGAQAPAISATLSEDLAMSIHAKDCLPESWWEVAHCVDTYEAAREGRFPNLRELVERLPPDSQTAAITELAAVDMEHRWEAGKPKSVERYLEEFPEILVDARYPEDLIGQEYQVRRECGEQPTVEEYRRRFPDYDVERIIGRLDTCTFTIGSATPTIRNEPRDPPPATIGRYRVLEAIGWGAFGCVYRCYDGHLKRDVAVKLSYRNTTPGPERLDEFLHEARSAARLRHPRIVSVLDAGNLDDGRAYVVFEYVAGQTLQERIRAGTYSREQAVNWCIEIARALHYAHTHQVVHRDVSPANVLIDPQGHVRLTDFGLCKVDDQYFRDDSGRVLGSLAYLSPEQARGDSHWATAQSDIYSLGVILYELLTGRRPFGVDSSRGLQEILAQVERRVPNPPRTIDDTIPKELEAVCLSAMAKSPADRYTTAADMATALHAAVAGPKTAFRFRRHLLVASLLAAAALLLMVPLGYYDLRYSRSRRLADMQGLQPEQKTRTPPPQNPEGDKKEIAAKKDYPYIEFVLIEPGKTIRIPYGNNAYWARPNDGDGLRLKGLLPEEGRYVSVIAYYPDGSVEWLYRQIAQTQKRVQRFVFPEDVDGKEQALVFDGVHGHGWEAVVVVVSEEPLSDDQFRKLEVSFRPPKVLNPSEGPITVPTPNSLRERFAPGPTAEITLGEDLAERLEGLGAKVRYRAIVYWHQK